MDLSVTLPKGDGSVVFKNPIMTACGCFGNIVEYMDAFDITRLGAAVSNSFHGRVSPTDATASAIPKAATCRPSASTI